METTRRNVLAGLGTAAVASVSGCSLLEESDTPTQFSTADFETILAVSAPEVQRPVPIHPDTGVIDAGLNRCSELLSTVPASISIDQIPNGAVREEVERIRDNAIEAQDAVESEPDRFYALLSLRDARATAREAAVAFEAVRENLVRDVEDARREARTAVGTRLAQVAYAGDDRGRTLLVAYRIEQCLFDARRRVNRGFRTPDPSVLDIGNLAGDVEYAAATLGTVDTFAERHIATVDDPTDFTAPASAALESTVRSLSHADLPSPETSDEELFGEELERRELQFLLREALRGVDRWRGNLSTELTANRLASGLNHAIRLERNARALKAVIQRIDNGDVPELESIEPIRNEREAAIEAAEAVPIAATEPSLAGDVVARSLQQIEWTDRELEGYIQRDRNLRLEREYASYIYLRAQFEALPDAIESVRGRLDMWSTSSWG